MDYQNNQSDSGRPQGGFQSQMHDVTALNLTCANCGTAITELPFEPTKKEDGSFGKLYCRECNAKRPKRSFGGGGGRGFGGGGGGYQQRNNRY